MSGDAPVTDATPVAAAADTDLLDAPAEPNAPAAETPDNAGDAPAAESKPEGDKPSGEDGEKAKDDASAPDLLADDDEGKTPKAEDGQADSKKDGAPETYEAFTLPDGVTLDEPTLAKATPVFKDVGLSQDQAQKLVSLYADMQAEAAAKQVEGFNQVKKDWANEIKADAEFGGEKLAQTTGAAKAVIAKFGSPRLLADLKEWGWSNHPEFLRMCARIKASLSEDTLVTGDAAAQARPRSAAERLYPNMPGDNQ